MSYRTWLALPAVMLLGLALDAAEKALKSGLQPGDKTTPFNIRDITGPNKGKSLCYV